MEVVTRLTESEIKQLCEEFENVRLCLLYKASVHGFTAQAFHAKSDCQGPSVVVAYNESGCVYGGYSREGFRSRQELIKDEQAFIFKLNTGVGKNALLKIPVKNPDAAIYDHSRYGPVFGNSALSFNGNQVTSAVTNTYEFLVTDLHENDPYLQELEVYRVEDTSDTKDTQWRSISWTADERRRLMDLVKNYKPTVYDIPHIRVLMVGPRGVGKSSFINSVNSVFHGHVVTRAPACSSSTTVTKKYRAYSIKDGKCGKTLPIMLCDSMGSEEPNGAGLLIQDVPKILEGHVADRYQFHPAVSIQPDSSFYIKSPSLKDRIHVVVFVLNSSTVDNLLGNRHEKVKQLRATISQYDVPILGLLTGVDKISPAIKDLRDVYKSGIVVNKISTASHLLGIPASSILPIKNYSHELELDHCVDILILHAMQQIIRVADIYFDDLPDDLEE